MCGPEFTLPNLSPSDRRTVVVDPRTHQITIQPLRHFEGRTVFSETGAGFNGYAFQDGWAFVDGPGGAAGHRWNAPGFDGVAFRVEGDFELHIFDNKALRARSVGNATALTQNLLGNLDEMIVRANSPSFNDVPRIAQIRQALADTRSAIRTRLSGNRSATIPSRVKLVVGNFAGQSTGVSRSLQREIRRLTGSNVVFRNLNAAVAGTGPVPPGILPGASRAVAGDSIGSRPVAAPNRATGGGATSVSEVTRGRVRSAAPQRDAPERVNPTRRRTGTDRRARALPNPRPNSRELSPRFIRISGALAHLSFEGLLGSAFHRTIDQLEREQRGRRRRERRIRSVDILGIGNDFRHYVSDHQPWEFHQASELAERLRRHASQYNRRGNLGYVFRDILQHALQPQVSPEDRHERLGTEIVSIIDRIQKLDDLLLDVEDRERAYNFDELIESFDTVASSVRLSMSFLVGRYSITVEDGAYFINFIERFPSRVRSYRNALGSIRGDAQRLRAILVRLREDYESNL